VIPSADAFFWYVETDTAPQLVAGLGLFAPSPRGPVLEDVRRRVERSLDELPAFRRRLEPGTRWRRPRWVDVGTIDLAYHVTEHNLCTATGEPAGTDALYEYVAELTATRLSIDRPLWRIILVRGVSVDQSALVLLAHHTIADGLGIVASAVRFLDPRITPPRTTEPVADGSLGRAWSQLVGLAQLATDGTPKAPLSLVSSPKRQFRAASFDVDAVRNIARRHHCRVTDVLLSAVAGALSQQRQDLAATIGSRLRVAVPLLVPASKARSGNITAGVMVDLPLEPMPEARRLALIATRTRRLRTPSRAVASRMVVARGLALAPPFAARRFAQTVYGHRFFHAIVTNITGPPEQLNLTGSRLAEVIPILPLAPGAPIAVGALSWTGTFGIGISTDPAVLSATDLTTGLSTVIAELSQT
jgi:diacylglycerol O-acyltransferase